MTMGWPATRWYCLGKGGCAGAKGSPAAPASAPNAEMVEPAGAAGGAATAREPVPAQGTSAQKRPCTDVGACEAVSEGCSSGSMVMRGPF